MKKIKEIQFPLLHTPEAIQAIENKGVHLKNTIQQTCFKAQLFIPYKKEISLVKFNSDCIVGYWIYFRIFLKENFKTSLFYIPTKKEWMLSPNNSVNWKDYKEMVIFLNECKEKRKSPMLWRKKSENKIEKLFVVWW